MYHVNINVNLIVENVIQIKSGISINVDGGAKIRENVVCVKKILFVILANVLAKMINIWKLLLVIQ